ncbi:YybH family protein [Anatilimnocola floriformis]|uniref:YybH family protein n=1 Tax=Anatilimnocola floriformis TaxID=2948575 RepID=UPI0020C418D4|nr:nuclear transport factor 2 family protein [Anatilimnocola floriformis]
MRTIVVLIALAASLASAGQNEPAKEPEKVATGGARAEAIHDQLRAVREEFLTAFGKQDFDALVALLDENVVLTAQDGKELKSIRSKQGVREYLDRMLVGPKRGIESMTIKPTVDELSALHNGDTAVATGSSLDHYKLSDGNEFDLKTRWSVTLIDKNGKWLIANLHVSTSLFDNPVISAVSRAATWAAIGIGAVALLVGFGGGMLMCRNRSL